MHNMTITKRGLFNTTKEVTYGCGSSRVGSNVEIGYKVTLDITGALKSKDQYFDHREIDQVFSRYHGMGNRKSLERLVLESTDSLRQLITRHGLTANSIKVELSPETEDDPSGHFVSAEHTWYKPIEAVAGIAADKPDVDHASRHALEHA